MIFISHRGNLNGPISEKENKLNYLKDAFNKGYQVEADVWYDNGWWLGHAEPTYKCVTNDLYYFWCHAKNKEALINLINNQISHYFWHQEDDYTLTSQGYIWVHSKKHILKNSICVLPELGYKGDLQECAGICSDNIEYYNYANANIRQIY